MSTLYWTVYFTLVFSVIVFFSIFLSLLWRSSSDLYSIFHYSEGTKNYFTLYSSTFLPSRLCHFLPYFTSLPLHPYIFSIPSILYSSICISFSFLLFSFYSPSPSQSLNYFLLSSFFPFPFCSPSISCNEVFSISPFHHISDSLFLLLPLSISNFFLSFPALLLFPSLSVVLSPSPSFSKIHIFPLQKPPFLQSSTFSCLFLPSVLELFSFHHRVN